MNGAEALVDALVAADVDVCFANPGTSEMHFVAALDSNPRMRSILCLFEGVATGAADGYARMAGKPAATLLHLGPGLANAGANLHNAKRAQTPIVNIVGDHATGHVHLDAPLTSDIEGLARTWSTWVRTTKSADAVAGDTHAAVQAARGAPGSVATLVLPADAAWNDAAPSVRRPFLASLCPQVPEDRLRDIVAVLERGEPTMIFVEGRVLADPAALAALDRIAQKTGAMVRAKTVNARVERGAGRAAIDVFPYSVTQGLAAASELRHCILLGTSQPVGFFAYPGLPGLMLPAGCAVHTLALPEEDHQQALQDLSCLLGADKLEARVVEGGKLEKAAGALTPQSLAMTVAARLPEGAVVCDEAITMSGVCRGATTGAAPHSWLQLTGGAIGIGLPLATGAAVAAPDRRVVALQADGSAAYTLQALWTQAREQLDVVTIILANRTYAILRYEMSNLGIGNPGPKALGMTKLDQPALDWVRLAQGMGVEAARAATIDELDDLLAAALKRRGPFLIEAVLG